MHQVWLPGKYSHKHTPRASTGVRSPWGWLGRSQLLFTISTWGTDSVPDCPGSPGTVASQLLKTVGTLASDTLSCCPGVRHTHLRWPVFGPLSSSIANKQEIPVRKDLGKKSEKRFSPMIYSLDLSIIYWRLILCNKYIFPGYKINHLF